MTVEELLLKLTEEIDKQNYKVIIPADRTGDIDEIEELPLKHVTWDIAEKRVILEW